MLHSYFSNSHFGFVKFIRQSYSAQSLHCISGPISYDLAGEGENMAITVFPAPPINHQLINLALMSWDASCLGRPLMRWYTPAVVAPPIPILWTSKSLCEQRAWTNVFSMLCLTLHGPIAGVRENPSFARFIQASHPGLPVSGVISNSSPNMLPWSFMQVPSAKRLIHDSAKLSSLDTLLQELKAGDHRVLIYSQMTKMMDLMEEYLVYRQYKYLRLDGSSKLEDRRDMVMDWQTRPDIFIFLLSTRAGGLGINLTAADTVIFYDHDWNPSNDSQAMDRAHRLGQTRQVTVYRLITKGTIDERIVQLARVKKDVQDIVVGNKPMIDMAKPNEIVSLLLNDDELANLSNNPSDSRRDSNSVDSFINHDLWADEGDDFFGHQGTAIIRPEQRQLDASTQAETAADQQPKKRRGAARGKTRFTSGHTSPPATQFGQ